MIIFNRFFNKKIKHQLCSDTCALCSDTAQRGGMMIELLLSLALAAVMLPFILRQERTGITRAENIALSEQISGVRLALERYMDAHKKELLRPVGKNITRVQLSDLEEFGAPTQSLEKYKNDFQLRILKSPDRTGQPSLQGLVVMTGTDITPMRTREIATLGGGNAGFVDNDKVFGAFGGWRANATDFGISAKDGILETTNPKRSGDDYLWRIPSENAIDATLASNINLGGHNLTGVKFLDAKTMRLEESLNTNVLVSDKLIFQNRTTLENNFDTTDTAVNGVLSSDSKNMEITGGLTLLGVGKFSSITAEELWTGNLRLSGLSVSNATIKINQSMNMTGGRVTAMFATVGFAGSVTPRLVVTDLLEDASDSRYFWDFKNSSAHFNDVSFTNLNQMASAVLMAESGGGTESGRIWAGIAANKNATAADFMNAISEISNQVRTKFQQLNLE